MWLREIIRILPVQGYRVKEYGILQKIQSHPADQVNDEGGPKPSFPVDFFHLGQRSEEILRIGEWGMGNGELEIGNSERKEECGGLTFSLLLIF